MIQGTIHTTNNCGNLRVIKYIDAKNITVQFISTGFIYMAQSVDIRKGSVKDKLSPMVVGVGYMGEGTHKPTINKKTTKPYKTWVGMIERCYCPKRLLKFPTYKDCTVCDEWFNFQNFAEWFDENYIEGYHLDKDVKIKGNRVYSPDSCLFISAARNAVEAKAKYYEFTSPSGTATSIYNLAAFCRENNLDDRNMSSLHFGKRKSHKGWTLPVRES